MKATVTSKGQITIPQAIRQKLKLQPGTVLEFDEQVADIINSLGDGVASSPGSSGA